MSSTPPRAAAPGQPIPTPADFPVSWEHPADAKLTWQLDTHFAGVQVPLIYSVMAAGIQGASSAFAQFGMPIHLRLKHLNGYIYAAFVPTAAPPEGVVKTMRVLNRLVPGLVKRLQGRMAVGMAKQQLDRLNPILAQLDVYWQDELLPEIKQHLAYFESCELHGLSLAQLRAHFADGLTRVDRLSALHFLAALSAICAMSQFEDLYCDLFEGATSLDALRLLQGFDNKTVEGNRRLWQLSRVAVTLPSVYQALAECPAVDVIPALEQSGAGRRFLADLRAYLQQYGQLLSPTTALTKPSWMEDPTIVIAYLKAYAARPNGRLEAEQAELVAEREQAIAEARAQLVGYPQPIVTRFETVLKAAQTGAVMSEDHHYWIDQHLWYHLRRLGSEFGRRLAEAGLLETADDVFYLTSEELLDEGWGGVTPSLRERVKERKAELSHFSHVTPPQLLGTMPSFELADGGPLFRALMKADPPGPTGSHGDAHTLHGQAGSPGVVRGIAKVVRSLAEAGKLHAGDVLVAEMTLPPWTPLFATAGAVVTDTGGVLSHCAIVAREYHIPAVVGTGRATKTFHDGQILEVDGTAGTVQIVTSPGGK